METEKNYKGDLQQHCQLFGWDAPTYETKTADLESQPPTWITTVHYGENVYVSPEPITGTKKQSEQITAKQILEQISADRENFLSQNKINKLKWKSEIDESEDRSEVEVETDDLSETTVVESSISEPIRVPTELITTALGIANHRLVELRRNLRNNQIADPNHKTFTKDLADLTLKIVRELAESAEIAGIKFGEID